MSSSPEESSQLARWLEEARRGDDAARNRLFEACRSFVALVAEVHVIRRLSSKVDASDLVQQSLLDAHRGFDRFRGQTPQEWYGWLRQVVAHNAADVARHYGQEGKRDARKEVPVAAEGDSFSRIPGLTPVARDPSPSQALVRHERELRLAEMLQQLSEDYRRVIVLRNLECLPFEEIADLLGRSRGACQMLWLRAMEQLRRQMQLDEKRQEAFFT